MVRKVIEVSQGLQVYRLVSRYNIIMIIVNYYDFIIGTQRTNGIEAILDTLIITY